MGKANALARVAKKVSGLLDDATPAKRASKAENEAAGLYHPIGGGLKLDRPVSEMSATVEQIRNLPQRRVLSPEQMQGGNILALIGDRTAAGRNLMAVNGQPLARPVELQGGPDFMRTHQGDSAAWASGQPVITKLSKAVQEAGGNGDPVYGAYTAMSHTAGDFSTMMADARTPHKTYDTQLGGVYQGGLEAPVPRELMYPEFFAKRRAEGRDPAGDNRAFMLAPVVQPANQQWLDGVMGYIEKAKRGLLD